MSRRVFHDPNPSLNMGDNRTLLVMADLTDEGLSVDGYDYASWPSSDYEWKVRVAPDQLEKLRAEIGAEAGEDTLDVFVARIDDGSYGPWLNIGTWFTEHGIEFAFTSRSVDN